MDGYLCIVWFVGSFGPNDCIDESSAQKGKFFFVKFYRAERSSCLFDVNGRVDQCTAVAVRALHAVVHASKRSGFPR